MKTIATYEYNLDKSMDINQLVNKSVYIDTKVVGKIVSAERIADNSVKLISELNDDTDLTEIDNSIYTSIGYDNKFSIGCIHKVDNPQERNMFKERFDEKIKLSHMCIRRARAMRYLNKVKPKKYKLFYTTDGVLGMTYDLSMYHQLFWRSDGKEETSRLYTSYI